MSAGSAWECMGASGLIHYWPATGKKFTTCMLQKLFLFMHNVQGMDSLQCQSIISCFPPLFRGRASYSFVFGFCSFLCFLN